MYLYPLNLLHLTIWGQRRVKQLPKLSIQVADAFALYVKTKNFHWHLSGPHFRDYHLLFDEQADQIFAMIDVLAERVRKVGGITIHSISHISQLQNIKDDNDPFVEPKEMLRRLLEDNKNLASRMLSAHQVCDDNQDVATASFLEALLMKLKGEHGSSMKLMSIKFE